MRRCKECGAPNTDEARFCRICGEPLPPVHHASPTPRKGSDGRNAPQARGHAQHLQHDHHVHGRQGSDLYTDIYRQRRRSTETHETSEEHKNVTTILAVALVIAVLFIVITLFPFFRSSRSSQSSVTASITEAAQTTQAAQEATQSAQPTQTAQPTAATTPPEFTSVSASSELTPESSNNYYGARNLTDGDTTTAWNEGASGDGIGETVTLSADTPQTVSGIRIMAGFDASQRTYNRNNRPRGITISYDGGQKQVELQDTYNEFQDIPLDAPASTTQITIRIDSVYKGNQYSDCCISEIEVY